MLKGILSDMENKPTAFLVSNPEPDLECYLRGRLYTPSTHAMLPICTNQQVKYFRKIILVVLYIALLSCPTSAFPKPKTRIKEESDKTVTIQVTGCRRASNDDLRRMMGPAFDDSKMDYDNDAKGDASTGYKRGSVKQSVIRNNKNNNEFLEEVEDFFDDEEELDELERPKTRESDQSSTISVQNREKYIMRRKRETPGEDNTNSLSDKKFLYQNMLHETLKRRKRSSSREKRGAWNHHQLQWECRKKDKWMKMKEGYFPSRIMEVKCKQKDCFFGMYTCNPVKYTVRVLKRDPVNACNPVPLISNSTVYEEVWNFKKIRVTVACECSNSWKSAKRKSGRGRHG